MVEISLEIEQTINESTKVKINITGYDQKHAVSVAHDMLADIKNRDNVIVMPKTE